MPYFCLKEASAKIKKIVLTFMTFFLSLIIFYTLKLIGSLKKSDDQVLNTVNVILVLPLSC